MTRDQETGIRGRGARGEALLTVDGEEYPILFTNRALAQAERVIDKPMLQLLSALEDNKLGIGDTAQLLAIGMEHGRRDAKAGGRAYTVQDAWSILDALGFTTVVTAVLGAIADVISFGVEEENASPPA